MTTTDYEARIADLEGELDELRAECKARVGSSTELAVKAMALASELSRSLSSEKARREGMERASCEHVRQDELQGSISWWCPKCGAIKFHGSPPLLPERMRSAPTVPEIAEGDELATRLEPTDAWLKEQYEDGAETCLSTADGLRCIYNLGVNAGRKSRAE